MAQAKDKDAKDEKAAATQAEEKPAAFGAAYGEAYDAVGAQATTVAESAAELRDFVDRMSKRMAKGSKSDIDKIVPLLELIHLWIDLLLNNVPEPPPQTLLARFDD